MAENQLKETQAALPWLGGIRLGFGPGVHRTPFSAVRWIAVAVFGLFPTAGGQHVLAAADPFWDGYVRGCEAPHQAGSPAAGEICSAFAARLAALANPSPEARLALFKARGWIGGIALPEAYCREVEAIAADLRNRPAVLLDTAVCSYYTDLKAAVRGTEGEERQAHETSASLVLEALAIDPEHVGSLEYLIRLVGPEAYSGRYGIAGIDAVVFARHAMTLYGLNGSIRAAILAVDAALAGMTVEADEFRVRVLRDLRLAELDYGPARRDESLTLACSDDVFTLGFANYCLSAIETLAKTAADRGEPMGDDVLRHLRLAFNSLKLQARQADTVKNDPQRAHRIEYEAWAGKDGLAARLKAVLDTHPEPSRSSEHYRAYASTAPTWGGRIAALRRAVELGTDNLEARCELASALANIGERAEAWSIYADLAAPDRMPPCDPEAGFQEIESLEQHGVPPRVGPDDPIRRRHYAAAGATPSPVHRPGS